MRRSAYSSAAVATAVAVFAGAAALAGCDASSGLHGGAGSGTSSTSSGGGWDRSPDSVAAVGDSITRGFDACEVLADCPEVSWATGSDGDVRSLAVRLVGRDVAERSWNLAVSGARMADLPEQMARAAQHRPELVAVLVGANDACRSSARLMTPVADFRTSFETAMRRLRAGAPGTQVYVSSVPDLKRLWSTGRGSTVGRQVWKLGLCPSMLRDAHDDGERAVKRRDRVYDRVTDYNDVLKDVCSGYPRCRYDGGEVFEYRFTETQLSQWDWFHPSKNGQARLAEIAYRNVTAAKPPA